MLSLYGACRLAGGQEQNQVCPSLFIELLRPRFGRQTEFHEGRDNVFFAEFRAKGGCEEFPFVGKAEANSIEKLGR